MEWLNLNLDSLASKRNVPPLFLEDIARRNQKKEHLKSLSWVNDTPIGVAFSSKDNGEKNKIHHQNSVNSEDSI